jgi:hypothetical protein
MRKISVTDLDFNTGGVHGYFSIHRRNSDTGSYNDHVQDSLYPCPFQFITDKCHLMSCYFALFVDSQTQSHVTTDGQSVRMSWYQVQSGICDQILFSV